MLTRECKIFDTAVNLELNPLSALQINFYCPLQREGQIKPLKTWEQSNRDESFVNVYKVKSWWSYTESMCEYFNASKQEQEAETQKWCKMFAGENKLNIPHQMTENI